MLIALLLLGTFVSIECFFNQKKNTSTSTLLLFRGIILLGLLFGYLWNIMSIGFRYLPILVSYGILLLFDAVRKPHKKPKKVLHIFLLFVAMIPSFLFPVYHPLPTSGPYSIVETMEVIVNRNQNRDIAIRIWSPQKTPVSTPSPIVIYSHGGISVDTSNETLARELASYGYIVVSLSHPGQSIVTKNQHGKNLWIDMEFLNQITSENASKSPHKSAELYQTWMSTRSQDLNFIIDHMKSETEHIPQIIVMGHSLGGSAAFCLGRQRTDITAIIALESPFMCDIQGVNDQGFIFDQTPYPIPVLSIYTDSAYPHLGVWPQYKQNYMHLLDSTSDVTSVYMENTSHFSITDLSLTSPLLSHLLSGSFSLTSSKSDLIKLNSIVLTYLLDQKNSHLTH